MLSAQKRTLFGWPITLLLDQPVNIPHRGARYIVYATYMPEEVGGVFAVMGDDFTLDFRV